MDKNQSFEENPGIPITPTEKVKPLSLPELELVCESLRTRFCSTCS